MIMFGESEWIKILAKAVWQIKRLLIVTTNLDDLRLEIADDCQKICQTIPPSNIHIIQYIINSN